MGVSVRITGAKGAIAVLKDLADNIRAGPSRLKKSTVNEIHRLIVAHDDVAFRRSVKAAKPVTLPAAVFSRKKNYFGAKPSTIMGIEARVRTMTPLIDTGKLQSALTKQKSPYSTFRVTRVSMSLVIQLPYYKKHVTGASAYFRFGAEEIENLNQRVRKPRKKAKDILGEPFGKGSLGRWAAAYEKITRIYGEGETGADMADVLAEAEEALRVGRDVGKEFGDPKSSRAYYRLYVWALKKYPRRRRVPPRLVIVDLTHDERGKISDMILADLFDRSSKK